MPIKRSAEAKDKLELYWMDVVCTSISIAFVSSVAVPVPLVWQGMCRLLAT